MRPRDRELALRLDSGLLSFDRDKRPLAAIRDSARREAFLEQLLESVHRVEFFAALRSRELSDRRADPTVPQQR